MYLPNRQPKEGEAVDASEAHHISIFDHQAPIIDHHEDDPATPAIRGQESCERESAVLIVAPAPGTPLPLSLSLAVSVSVSLSLSLSLYLSIDP